MSGVDDEDKRRRRREKIAKAVYSVGYGKTPVEPRFVRGGPNPSRGRKPGSKNKKAPVSEAGFDELALAHGKEKVRITDQLGPREIPRVDALFHAAFASAMKGNTRAISLYLTHYERADARLRHEEGALLGRVTNQIRERWTEIHFCQKHGYSHKHVLPHPGHIVVGLSPLTLRIAGPSSESEQVLWDLVQEELQTKNKQMELLRKEMAECNLTAERSILKRMIALCQKQVDLYVWWTSTYDGGHRCRDGHTPQELNRAIKKTLGASWLEDYRLTYVDPPDPASYDAVS